VNASVTAGEASAGIESPSRMTVSLVQGAAFTMMVVRIDDPHDPQFASDLGRQIALSPRFFDNAPIVLDLKDNLGFLDAEEFEEARAVLKRHKLVLVGVQNGSQPQVRAAAAAGLPSFGTSSRRGAEQSAVGRTNTAAGAQAPAAPPPPAPIPASGGAKTKVITHPVRSGAQIYARGGDLVIASSVSPGAEIIADGHIHVYGALRGRAIAGASGDTEARIFAGRLDAELISVAGRYLVSDNIAPDYLGQPVQVALVDDRLTILRT
jgi:septum site-determining protein MinC